MLIYLKRDGLVAGDFWVAGTKLQAPTAAALKAIAEGLAQAEPIEAAPAPVATKKAAKKKSAL